MYHNSIIEEPAIETGNKLEPVSVTSGDKRGPENTEDLPDSPGDDFAELLGAGSGVLDIDDVPDSVPHRRYPQPLKSFSYHPNYISFRSGRWGTSKSQTCGVDLSVFVEVYYAAGISSKIVRLTVFGSGFSVGNIRKNVWLERGAFQDRLQLSIGPVKAGVLHMGENSPKTENSEASFTSTASTTIKVSGKAGGGKDAEGGAEASYSVSSAVSTKLSDFSVLNNSDGNNASWLWELTKMGAGDPKYTYPYDGPKSLVNFWGNIIPVPGLSRSTLFPACQAYWYAPLSFNEEVEFQVKVSQRMGYAVSNNLKFYAANTPAVAKAWNFKVDFNLDANKIIGLGNELKTPAPVPHTDLPGHTKNRSAFKWGLISFAAAAVAVLLVIAVQQRRDSTG